MRRPAVVGADVDAALGWMFVCVNDVIFYAYDVFYAMRMALIAIPVYWVLGFVLTWVLLFVLKPLALAHSPGRSLPAFALLGAMTPMLLYVPVSWTLAHGSFAPFIDPGERHHTFFVLACMGIIGAASALAAWRAVRRAA